MTWLLPWDRANRAWGCISIVECLSITHETLDPTLSKYFCVIYECVHVCMCMCLCVQLCREVRGQHRVSSYHALPGFLETESLGEPGLTNAVRSTGQ